LMAKLTVKDVLVGEVWLNSGQSNMSWSVENSNDPEQEIAAANWPEIRIFHVPQKESAAPQEDCGGEWLAVTPESIPGFSAVAYYFGRQLHKELKTPVGLIASAWGGTMLEVWLEAGVLAADPDYAEIVKRGKSLGEGAETKLKDGKMEFDLEFKELEFVPKDKKAKPLLIKLIASVKLVILATAQPPMTSLKDLDAHSRHHQERSKKV
jgi:hypothetical protein